MKRNLMISFTLVGWTLAGCALVEPNVEFDQKPIVPMPLGTSRVMMAPEVVEIGLQLGMSPEEIIDHGPEIRKYIHQSGGFAFKANGFTQAVVGVFGDDVFIAKKGQGFRVLDFSQTSPAQ